MAKIVLISVLITFFSGCISIPSDTKSTASSLINKSYIERLSQGYFEKNEDQVTGIELLRAEYTKLVEEGKKDQARFLRKDVVYDLISISDSLYQDFKDNLFLGKASFDSWFDITNLLLTGTAAAITGSVDAKTSLAAASTFLQGTKQTFDENFFASQTISTLIVSMDGERAKVKVDIIRHLRTKDVNEYTMGEALSDVQQYHRAGSLINAIVNVNQSTSSEANENVEKLKLEEEL